MDYWGGFKKRVNMSKEIIFQKKFHHIQIHQNYNNNLFKVGKWLQYFMFYRIKFLNIKKHFNRG